MKLFNLKWPVVCLLVMGLSTGVMAQTAKKKDKKTDVKKIEQTLEKAAKKAETVHRAEKSCVGFQTPQYVYPKKAEQKPVPNTIAADVKADAKTLKHAQYCIHCGQPILKANQTCAASEHKTSCTTRCPDCGRDLRDPKNVGADGVHRCIGKMKIKVAEKAKPAKKK